MTRRSALAVVVLTLVTFGLYVYMWLLKSREEMNLQGADVPPAIQLVVPIVNLRWMWRFCEGVERVTGGRLSAPVAAMLLLGCFPLGMAVIQHQLNRTHALPEARLA
jgi:hypothetical protein